MGRLKRFLQTFLSESSSHKTSVQDGLWVTYDSSSTTTFVECRSLIFASRNFDFFGNMLMSQLPNHFAAHIFLRNGRETFLPLNH
jgi:hypothetical protein